MNDSSVNCPKWIADQILNSGGIVSFHQYMDWALNDANHGAYSCGHLEIGIKGDFVTSPSLGPDFSELLAIQIVEWINELEKNYSSNHIISIVDIGAGEGDLSFYLINLKVHRHLSSHH